MERGHVGSVPQQGHYLIEFLKLRTTEKVDKQMEAGMHAVGTGRPVSLFTRFKAHIMLL